MKIVNFEGKRIKHISHEDLDGEFAFVLSAYAKRHTVPKSIDYTGIQPNELYNEILLETIPYLDIYDLVIITDLNISEEVYQILDQYNEKFLVFDHHINKLTNENGEFENDWLIINSHEDVEYIDSRLKKVVVRRKTCATKLYWNYLKETQRGISERNNHLVEGLVDIVRIYDTYEFRNSSDDFPTERYKLCKAFAPKVNMLFHAIPSYLFMEYMISFINRNKPLSRLLSSDDKYPMIKYIIDNEHEKNEIYVHRKVKSTYIDNFHGVKTGIVFSDSNISEIGYKVLQTKPEIDMCMIINGNMISLRSRIGSDIDVSEIASVYGGGGHVNASGFTLSKDELFDIYKKVAYGRVRL